jgi:hypothetical protein
MQIFLQNFRIILTSMELAFLITHIKNSVVLSPQASYTDRAIAAGKRS